MGGRGYGERNVILQQQCRPRCANGQCQTPVPSRGVQIGRNRVRNEIQVRQFRQRGLCSTNRRRGALTEEKLNAQ